MLVVCFGMMRSGSTWHYNLASRVIESLGVGRREGFYALDEWTVLTRRFRKWHDDDDLHVIKVHELPSLELLPLERTKFLVIYRNPVDVAKSAYRIWSQGIQESIKQIDRSLQVISQLSRNRRAIVHTYEQLCASPVSVVCDLCGHLGLSIGRIEAEQVVDETQRLARCRPTLGNRIRRAGAAYGRRLGVVGALGIAAKRLRIPKRLYFDLRRYSYPHDPVTLYQMGHIGMRGEKTLTDRELNILEAHYAEHLGGHFLRRE